MNIFIKNDYWIVSIFPVIRLKKVLGFDTGVCAILASTNARQEASASIISSCFPFGNFSNSSSSSCILLSCRTIWLPYLGCNIVRILASFSPCGVTSSRVKNRLRILIWFRSSNANIFWYATTSIHTFSGFHCWTILNTSSINLSGRTLSWNISRTYTLFPWSIPIVAIAV